MIEQYTNDTNGLFADIRLLAVILFGLQAAVIIINYIVTSLGELVLYATAVLSSPVQARKN